MHAHAKTSAHGWQKIFLALENHEFRWLLASNAAFFLCLHGQMLTRTFLAWNITQQEMSLAYINIAYAVPMIGFSLIGGVLTDRFERRRLIQLSQIVLIINEMAVLLLLVTNHLAFWNLLVAGVIAGTTIPLMMPARTAVIYNIVGPARLGNAMGLATGVVNMSRVIGPVIMAWAISQFEPVGAYFIATALFIAAFLFMLGVDKKPVEMTEEKRPKLLHDIQSGLAYIKANRPILVCLAFGYLTLSLTIPLQSLLILFADDVWQVGESGLGLLLSTAGLGGVLGSLWVASRGENARRIRLMSYNAIGIAVFLLLFSLSNNFYWALTPLLIAYLCASASNTFNNTTLQLIIDDKQRGRVSSFMMMTFAFTPLGAIPLAWGAKHIGIEQTMTIASLILMVMVSLFYLYSKTLRNIDQHVIAALKNKGSNQ